jgi:hypothetical protein
MSYLTVDAELQTSFVILGGSYSDPLSEKEAGFCTLNGNGSILGKVQVKSYGTIQPGDHSHGILTLKRGATFSEWKCTELSAATLSIRIAGPSSSQYDQLSTGGPIIFGKKSRISIEIHEDFQLEPYRQYSFKIIHNIKGSTPTILDHGVDIHYSNQSLQRFTRYQTQFDATTGTLSIVTGPLKHSE